MSRWARGILVLVILTFLTTFVSGSGAEQPYKLKMPLGLQEQAAYIPADNPPTPAKIALGKMLYFDKRLSADG
ncbi:MAG: cytochrome-c peroxidase, partial [Candidatus Methylomirabilales bacterium]